MIYISFAELLHTSIKNVGFLRANIGFFVGIAFIALLDVFIPHEYKHEDSGHSAHSLIKKKSARAIGEKVSSRRENPSSRLMRAGVLTAIGIAIHNFPEGLVTFSSALSGDQAFGILVAVAVAIHNIPEGISVSLPIMQATGQSEKGFYLFILCGSGGTNRRTYRLCYSVSYNDSSADIYGDGICRRNHGVHQS